MMPPRLSRRNFTRLLCLAGVPKLSRGAWAADDPTAFVHPGMLHTAADLRRMREAVSDKSEPIYSGFIKLSDDPHSQLSYKPLGALEEVSRNPTVGANRLEGDGNAAYQLALMGHLTGDPGYFQRCAAILDDWSGKLKRITGADAILCAGLAPFKMANAAELLRASNSGWPQGKVLRFAQFLRDVALPVIDNFAAFANGNWDTAALKTMLSIAIFTDDRPLFDRALVYYMHGCGDGRLEHYIYANGQCQESGRDQQHTQLGLAHMGDCCEMAWSQGLDLYGMIDNRLLLGFEYTARYELGEEVDFKPDIDRTGKYRHQMISPRSPLRPVFEQIYNHYANRRGLPAPWTAKASAQIRPEGSFVGADHTGFGTLLYSRPPGAPIQPVPSAWPGGLYASNDNDMLRLSWIPLAVGDSCTLVRTPETRRIAVQSPASSQDDPTAKPGRTYQYRVEAGRAGKTSQAVTAIAGLPAGWALTGIGDGAPQGIAFCAGDSWRMSADAGTSKASPGGLAFLARPFAPNGTMFSATLLPLFASQSLYAGIACVGDDGAAALLLLVPGDGSAGEHVAWAVRLWTRARAKGQLSMEGEVVVAEPAVRYGRLYARLGLRFRKAGAVWLAEYTADGAQWNKVGKCGPWAGNRRAGMVLNSGIAGVSTEVLWEKVSAV